jgi:hypothetical protein
MYRHPGIAKTLERLSRDYYFLGAKRKVESVISKYYVYNTAKTARHKPYGKL